MELLITDIGLCWSTDGDVMAMKKLDIRIVCVPFVLNVDTIVRTSHEYEQRFYPFHIHSTE
jgi:hypothetical protein